MGRWRRKRHALGRADSRLEGQGTRVERTSNILLMSVTLDVSKLSGWLKARAFCRVEKRGVRCGARYGPGGGGAWGGRAAAQAACTGKARLKA